MKLKIKGTGTGRIARQITDVAKEKITEIEISRLSYGITLKIELNRRSVSIIGRCSISYLPYSDTLYITSIVDTEKEAVTFINNL